MQNSYLPIEILQYISEYMPNTFVMKSLCKQTYYTIRLYSYKIVKSIKIHRLQYVRDLSVSDVRSFDFSVFKSLRILSLTRCYYAEIRKCKLTHLEIDNSRQVFGLSDYNVLKSIVLKNMNMEFISCPNMKNMSFINCKTIVADSYKKICLDSLVCISSSTIILSDFIKVKNMTLIDCDMPIEHLKTCCIRSLKTDKIYTLEEISRLNTLKIIEYTTGSLENYDVLRNTDLQTRINITQFGDRILHTIYIRDLAEINNRCVLPMSIFQHISKYLEYPFILKTLCKSLYNRLKLEHINPSNSICSRLYNILHLKYLRKMELFQVNNINLGKLSLLTDLTMMLCRNIDITDCSLMTLSMFNCSKIVGFDEQKHIIKLSLDFIDDITMIDCTTIKSLYLNNCSSIDIYTTSKAVLNHLFVNKNHFTISGDVTVYSIDLQWAILDRGILTKCRVVELILNYTRYDVSEITDLKTLKHFTVYFDPQLDYSMRDHYLTHYNTLKKSNITTDITLTDINFISHTIRINISLMMQNLDFIRILWPVTEIQKILKYGAEKYF